MWDEPLRIPQKQPKDYQPGEQLTLFAAPTAPLGGWHCGSEGCYGSRHEIDNISWSRPCATIGEERIAGWCFTHIAHMARRSYAEVYEATGFGYWGFKHRIVKVHCTLKSEYFVMRQDIPYYLFEER